MNEVHGASGAYVADALDTTERAEFEDHLANCELCRREVDEFDETLAQLSAVTELAPPVELRSSVLAAIGSVAQLPPLGDGPRHARSPLDVDEPVERVAPSAPVISTLPQTPTQDAPVDELALRRSRRARRVLTFAVAAVAVVALSLGGWVVGLQRQAHDAQVAAARQSSAVAQQSADAQKSADAKAAAEAAQSKVLAAPDAKVYAVTMQDGSKASWVVSKGLDQAVFVSPTTKSLPSSKLYQLWTVNGSAPNLKTKSIGTISGSGDQQLLVNGVSKADALAVSIEPRNGGRGSQAPTTTPFAPATISA